MWISTKERLPKDGKRVLVYSPDYEDKLRIRIFDGRFVKVIAGVTHWMPLPEPPKENEDGA